jgi:hypothetical protein
MQKSLAAQGNNLGGKKIPCCPQKIGHSGEFPRNVFQDAGKKIGSLRNFYVA